MTKRKKKGPRPRLIVHIRKLIVGAEDHTYTIQNVPARKQDMVMDALEKIKALTEIRVENKEIIAGVVEDAHDDIWDYEKDGEFPGITFSAGALTKEVRDVIGGVLGPRIRTYFEEETESLGELVFGEGWEDDVALTAEERRALSY